MSRGPMPPGAKPRTSVGPRLKLLMMRQLPAAEPVDLAGLHANEADEVVGDRIVVAAVERLAHELRIAAEAGDVLLVGGDQARGRVLAVVERVVDQREAGQRGDDCRLAPPPA